MCPAKGLTVANITVFESPPYDLKFFSEYNFSKIYYLILDFIK